MKVLRWGKLIKIKVELISVEVVIILSCLNTIIIFLFIKIYSTMIWKTIQTCKIWSKSRLIYLIIMINPDFECYPKIHIEPVKRALKWVKLIFILGLFWFGRFSILGKVGRGHFYGQRVINRVANPTCGKPNSTLRRTAQQLDHRSSPVIFNDPAKTRFSPLANSDRAQKIVKSYDLTSQIAVLSTMVLPPFHILLSLKSLSGFVVFFFCISA